MIQRMIKAYHCTFIGDAVLLALFMRGGLGWFPALVFTEILMWMIRLVWISRSMLLYIGKRLLYMVPILLAVVALGFFLIELAPGDMFTQLEMNPAIAPGDIENMRRQFNLDKSWIVQFISYIGNILTGNFGTAFSLRAPVFTIVRQRAANTVLLSVTSLFFAWGLSIPMGIWAAVKQYKWQDQLISVFAFVGLAIPNFFLAFLLLFVVTATSGVGGTWLPIGGMTSIDHGDMTAVGRFLDIAKHMVIPVIVLGTSGMAQLTRIMRSTMLETMERQYIVTARAKGQIEPRVIWHHGLRNAINPMITILGFQISSIMSGAALTEIVLSWPGLGSTILTAILQQDLYLVVGSLIYSTILLVIGNLIADILLALTDPRIRMG